LINAFDYTFWEKRYSTDSFACRTALKAIKKYLMFHNELTNFGDGILPEFSTKLNKLKPALIKAKTSVNNNIDRELRDL
jgi:hypothetical protein